MMNKSHIIGYLLGLFIFVIGIPTLMWLVSGRPWPYVPDSALLCTIGGMLGVSGLALSIYSIVYMRIVGKGNPFDAYGHEGGSTNEKPDDRRAVSCVSKSNACRYLHLRCGYSCLVLVNAAVAHLLDRANITNHASPKRGKAFDPGLRAGIP